MPIDLKRTTPGLVALAAGLLLSIAAVLVLVDAPRSHVGDVEAAEALPVATAPPPLPIPSGPHTTNEPPEPTSTTPGPAPLWQPNTLSSLAETHPTDEAPSPVGLRIGRISVDASVEPRGVDPDTGQMDVSDNVTEVGWYRFGPTPGEPGSAVLAAHVDLRGEGPGIFFNLRELEPGDRIEVLYDDGKTASFEVEARKTYSKEALPLDVIFRRDGPALLTLVTCGGDFDSSTSRYDSNVVVYARPKGPS